MAVLFIYLRVLAALSLRDRLASWLNDIIRENDWMVAAKEDDVISGWPTEFKRLADVKYSEEVTREQDTYTHTHL
jgi:hypothetical protein